VCKSSKQAKRGKFVWVVTIVLDIQYFGMNNKKREENKSLEMEQPWRVNYGACEECFWSISERNTEEISFQD
jgi:hypothetical protein